MRLVLAETDEDETRDLPVAIKRMSSVLQTLRTSYEIVLSALRHADPVGERGRMNVVKYDQMTLH
jgi:hypothetical protein